MDWNKYILIEELVLNKNSSLKFSIPSEFAIYNITKLHYQDNIDYFPISSSLRSWDFVKK